VVGRILSASFDCLITLEPHLHRLPSLANRLPDERNTVTLVGYQARERSLLEGVSSVKRRGAAAI